MTKPASALIAESKYARANGIDIHYVEAGDGDPLLLLHGGMVSNNPVWADSPIAYVSHIGAFAEHFRVIAPDLRGHGKTVNAGGGPISFSQLADDAWGLLDTLGVDRPLLCGFSAGATVATVLATKNPDRVRALVNDAGYDMFNPNPKAPVFSMGRKVFGGSPDATEGDASALGRFFASQGMSAVAERMAADHDGAQGAGAWNALIRSIFPAFTTPALSWDDLGKITAPTLVMTGDRDFLCSVEEAVTAFRKLAKGELAILPGHGHYVPASAIPMKVAFLRKCKG
jgi:pimeloyl-ACP methyl ester carboxylesterase